MSYWGVQWDAAGRGEAPLRVRACELCTAEHLEDREHIVHSFIQERQHVVKVMKQHVENTASKVKSLRSELLKRHVFTCSA